MLRCRRRSKSDAKATATTRRRDPRDPSGELTGVPLWPAATQAALYTQLGYRPDHPAQTAFLYDWAHRYQVVICPRRAGKSYTAAKKALPLVLGRRADAAGQPVPTTGWIVGPTYDLVEPEFQALLEDLQAGAQQGYWPKPLMVRNSKKSGDFFILTAWHSKIVGKSADKPQSLLGRAVDWVILAEAAQHPEPVWTKYLMATLATTEGYALFPTTPEEGAQWLYDLDVRGEGGADPLVASYHWPVTANPIYPAEEVEKARALYGEDSPVFREQFLGEWTWYSGTVYGRHFDPTRNVVPRAPLDPGWRIIRAIDFGYRDPFVCKWYALTNMGTLRCFREYYQPERDLPVHAATIRELSARDPAPVWYTVADRSEPQQRAELARLGVPTIPSDSDRRAGRIQLGAYLRTGQLVYEVGACPETIRELRGYRWAADANREGQQEKTLGDDHGIDTDRYAVMSRPTVSVRRPGVPRESFAGELAARERSRAARIWPSAAAVTADIA